MTLSFLPSLRTDDVYNEVWVRTGRAEELLVTLALSMRLKLTDAAKDAAVAGEGACGVRGHIHTLGVAAKDAAVAGESACGVLALAA